MFDLSKSEVSLITGVLLEDTMSAFFYCSESTFGKNDVNFKHGFHEKREFVFDYIRLILKFSFSGFSCKCCWLNDAYKRSSIKYTELTETV